MLPPMATAKAEEDGRINQDILNYYAEKSQGGHISLVIIEHSLKEGVANYFVVVLQHPLLYYQTFMPLRGTTDG